MSASSKRRRSDIRKKNKKDAKAAKKALYESYAKQGRKNNKKDSNMQPSLRKHPQVPCGNAGCESCRKLNAVVKTGMDKVEHDLFLDSMKSVR